MSHTEARTFFQAYPACNGWSQDHIQTICLQGNPCFPTTFWQPPGPVWPPSCFPHFPLVPWFQLLLSLSHSRKNLTNLWVSKATLSNSPTFFPCSILQITPYQLQVHGHSPVVGKLKYGEKRCNWQSYSDLSPETLWTSSTYLFSIAGDHHGESIR